MRIIDDYIDLIKTRHDLPSDRAAAKLIGISSSSINHWRLRRTWPSDRSMIKVAELAGIDEQEAVADLHIWMAKTEDVRALWQKISASLSATAAMLFLVVFLWSPGISEAGQTANKHAPAVQDVHIMAFLYVWLR